LIPLYLFINIFRIEEKSKKQEEDKKLRNKLRKENLAKKEIEKRLEREKIISSNNSNIDLSEDNLVITNYFLFLYFSRLNWID
jgi:hypothetical protein